MDRDLVLRRRAWRMLDRLGAIELKGKFRSNEMILESINIINLRKVTEADIRRITPNGVKVIEETLKLRDSILQCINRDICDWEAFLGVKNLKSK